MRNREYEGENHIKKGLYREKKLNYKRDNIIEKTILK